MYSKVYSFWLSFFCFLNSLSSGLLYSINSIWVVIICRSSLVLKSERTPACSSGWTKLPFWPWAYYTFSYYKIYFILYFSIGTLPCQCSIFSLMKTMSNISDAKMAVWSSNSPGGRCFLLFICHWLMDFQNSNITLC